MLNKRFAVLPLVLLSSLACAEVKPYISADVGIADTDFDTSLMVALGGGIQFNDNVEFEIAYNNYGDVGPYEIKIDSFSYGLNLGGRVNANTRVFAIIGAERLEADDTAKVGPFRIEVDESSTEAYFGIGAAFESGDSSVVRTKIVSHDSADLLTFSVGFAFYF